MTRTLAVRLRQLPAGLVAGVASMLAAGFMVGGQHAWAASEPMTSFIPPSAFIDLVALAGAAVLVLGAVIFAVRRSRLGPGLLLCLVAAGIGWGAGDATGPRWQPARAVTGTLTLDLLVPVNASFTGPATCAVEANGDRIVEVRASRLGVIGLDTLDARVATMDTPTLELLVNGMYGYSATIEDATTAADTRSGGGSFEARADGARIGGPGKTPQAGGRISWACDWPPVVAPTAGELPTPHASGPPPEPTAVSMEAVEGLFDLTGLVEWETCPKDQPCKPYGHASGRCSTALELRAEYIETIVPWTEGRQARLHLVPRPDSATLTVELDDGSPAETVTSPIQLTVADSGGFVGYRAVEGDFRLAEGTLHMYVEWQCGSMDQPE